jgi:hypothetical protein
MQERLPVPYCNARYAERIRDWLRAGELRGRSLCPGRRKIFSSPRRRDWFGGPCSLMSMGEPGIKRPRRQAHYSPPTSGEVRNTWIYSQRAKQLSKAIPVTDRGDQ